MSVENALEYLRMLDADSTFSQEIMSVAGDKAEQMKVINERGLDFTKEEFKQALTECILKEASPKAKGKQKLSDSDLESVNAAGIFGGIAGWFVGTIGCLTCGGVHAVKKTVSELVDGKSVDRAISSGCDTFENTATGVYSNLRNYCQDMIPF